MSPNLCSHTLKEPEQSLAPALDFLDGHRLPSALSVATGCVPWTRLSSISMKMSASSPAAGSIIRATFCSTTTLGLFTSYSVGAKYSVGANLVYYFQLEVCQSGSSQCDPPVARIKTCQQTRGLDTPKTCVVRKSVTALS
jgi:hypothetical protein